MRASTLFVPAMLAFTSYAHPLLGLDIGGLLGSLGPASPDDSRFHTWSPPGAGDGTFAIQNSPVTSLPQLHNTKAPNSTSLLLHNGD